MLQRIISAMVLVSAMLLLAACGPYTAVPPAQASPAPSAAPTAAGTSAERVTGTVQSRTADKVTLADGRSFTITPQTRITRREPATPADLQPGQYVAVTAKRQADGTLLASSVNIFAESMRGLAPGQRPMDAGNLMTNATIDTITGDAFTVTFAGGGARVKLAPDAKMSKLVVGAQEDIRQGESISASVTNGVAQSVLLQ